MANKLRTVRFRSKTNDDNKDKDTAVTVRVSTADRKTVLAEIVKADASDDDATEYNDGSTHDLNLTVNSQSEKTDCDKFVTDVTINADGDDEWHFDARVDLFFEDGSALTATKNGNSLNSEDGGDATVTFSHK